VDAAGRPFRQEWGWLGPATDRCQRYVRRIRLERAGQEAVTVVTDLRDAQAYPAADLLAVYRVRWQIETVFQQITEVFALRHLIGCTPQATVFQASLCRVIYNIVQLIRGYVAAGRAQPVPLETLSTAQIFRDLHEELVSLHRLLAVEELLGCLPVAVPAAQVRGRLQALLSRAWSPRWRKAADKKPRPAKPKARQSGAHTSIHKILQQAKQQQATPAPRKNE
jgi:hypothetical protein